VTKLLSLFDIWNLYENEVSATLTQEQAHATVSRTKTALLRYTLPGWGFVLPKGGKLTSWETEMALNYMKGISLEQFEKAAWIQQQVFDLQQVPSNIQRTYRAALKKLLAWCEQQQWWLKSQHNIATIFSPPRKQKRSAVTVRVTDRKYIDINGKQIQSFYYGLGFVEGDVIPDKLQQELDDFKQFRTGGNNSSSKHIVQDSTYQKELKNIRMILGWLYRFKGIPLAKISLFDIIRIPSEWDSNPFVPLEQSRKVAKQTVDLFKEYIQWLETDMDNNTSENQGRGAKSKHTKISVARIFVVVAKYLHHKGYFHSDINNVEIVKQSLNSEIAKIKVKSSDNISSSDISKKWLDWPEFLALIEQLRKECNSRVLQDIFQNNAGSNLGNLRSLPAIANSYQRFIFAALLAYLPPQNQQIYRHLEISHCRKYEDVKDKDELSGISGCLYQEDNDWYIYLLSDEYKMGARQIQFSFKIPNIEYSDGRNFYQYLNEWVYEYVSVEYHDRAIIVNGLRNVLNPQHNFLFTKKNGKEYLHQTEFSNLLRIPAYRISGKALTPGLLKRIFLKYIFEKQSHLLVGRKLNLQMSCPAKPPDSYDIWRRSREDIEVWIDIAKKIAQDSVCDTKSGTGQLTSDLR
jgi:hypothetical protein